MAIPPVKLLENEPGGGIVAAMRGQNALRRSDLQNEILKAEAQFAPQTAYANAMSRIAYANMLPYQIKASVLSNPLLWEAFKSNPNAMANMMKEFAQSVPEGNNLMGGMKMPPPNQSGGIGSGMLGFLFNQLYGNKGAQSQQNAMQNKNNSISPGISPSPQNQGADSGYEYDPQGNNVRAMPEEVEAKSKGVSLLPSSQGGMAGVSAKMTAPYNTSPYKAGDLVLPPGAGPTSVASAQTVSQIQQSYLALQNVVPVLDDIAKRGEKLLSNDAFRKLGMSKLVNLADQWGLHAPDWALKKLGVDKKLFDEFAKWNADRKKAVEGMMGGLSLPGNIPSLQDVHGIIDPLPGETGKGYASRIHKEKDYLLNQRLPQYQKMLGSGVPISNKESVIPNFNSQKEFKDWYANQTPEIKLAVRKELGGS